MSRQRHQLNRESLNSLRARSERLRLVASLAFGSSIFLFSSLLLLNLIPLLEEKKQLTQQLEQLELAESQQKAKLELLKIEVNALKDDPAYVELVARDILGLALPHEKLLEIKR